MKRISLIYVLLAILAGGCSLINQPTGRPDSEVATLVARATAATRQTQIPQTAGPVVTEPESTLAIPTEVPVQTQPVETATTEAPTRRLWAPYGSSAAEVWVFGEGDPHLMELRYELGQYYDYAPLTGRILFASHFAEAGAGPGNVSVSNLWAIDPEALEERTIRSGDDVVGARWMPNGRDLVYILATPATYELRLRRAEGEDILLATDVTFTWSISPDGRFVAFSRETGYGLDIDPGYYLVSIQNGREYKVSDADKRGIGSIGNTPAWSPDSKRLLVSGWDEEDQPRLVTVQVDGNRSEDISLDPSLASNWWYTLGMESILWHPDLSHLLGVPAAAEEPFGPSALIYYELGPDGKTIMGGTELAKAAALIDWNVPGESAWILNPDGEMELVEIP